MKCLLPEYILLNEVKLLNGTFKFDYRICVNTVFLRILYSKIYFHLQSLVFELETPTVQEKVRITENSS